MKRTLYFSTKEELDTYFPSGVPSTVLAIVQPDTNSEASLYTSSNNSPLNPGKTEEQGGNLEPEFGYSYIVSNGDYDITSYSYVNVNVPTGGSSTDEVTFPMLMFKEWGFENWRYAIAEDNNLTISFGLNDQAYEKMVDYIAVSSFNGENVDRMTLKPLSIDCSPSARENWPSSYTGLDYYYWSNAPADPEAEGYHYDSNADMVVSFFELTNLEDPMTGDTFEGEVTVNLSYNTSTGVWSATWDEAVVEEEVGE